jgi:pantoate--beta-alanine ligase
VRAFYSVHEWREFRRNLRDTLGFVPTMGALHEGHLSLVRCSQKDNQRTLVSIFVNPTQFDDPGDLDAYPRTLDSDLELLNGVDYVLCPSAKEMYPDGYRYRVSESVDSTRLCGAHRPGHFDGMLTVVLKLLGLAQAQKAYFGEKDFQQLHLVRGLVEEFFLPVEIVGCPTLREPDGLAMSSRNRRLDPAARELAPRFSRILRTAMDPGDALKQLAELGFAPDYVEDWQGRRLGAVKLGDVRLIDNVELS